MKDLRENRPFMIIVIIIIFSVIGWWEHYRYSECLRVGHTKFYCMMEK